MLRTDQHDPATIFGGLLDAARTFTGTRDQRMRSAADALWEALHPVGVSWIGFYEIAPENNTHGAEPGNAMILGPHRDKPACSPIGLHGACGRSWRQRRALVVTDVANLGEGYVACDPRDRAELVLPCLDNDGSCWGVLDADSYEPGCFDLEDAHRLGGVLVAAGLTHDVAREPLLI